ncbi:MAG: hypothetical protein U0Q16_08085 [Bryobacteraceae bacterium]
MREMDDSLDRLFRRYREVTPDPEASADFMPRLWQKIEARRGFSWKLQSYARAVLTLSATACLALAAFEFVSMQPSPSLQARYYVEALDDDHGPDAIAGADLANVSLVEDAIAQ